MQTSLEEMARMISRFHDEMENLKNYLDELTMNNGTGYLRELKDIVGANTDLGMTISNLGGAVMSAKTNVISKLQIIYDTMVEKYNQYANAIAEATHQYEEINAAIDQISFV